MRALNLSCASAFDGPGVRLDDEAALAVVAGLVSMGLSCFGVLELLGDIGSTCLDLGFDDFDMTEGGTIDDEDEAAE
jgi:hypothetical protein